MRWSTAKSSAEPSWSFEADLRGRSAMSTTGQPLNRRAFFRLGATSVGMVALAACAELAPSQPPPSPTSAPQPAGSAPPTVAVSSVATVASVAPRSGGTLRIGQVGDLVTLEPDYNELHSSPTVWSVFDRLTQYDLKLVPQPMLAESWDVSPDYKQIKLTLRKGVQFHNGREFTSDDVKYTLQRVTDPKVGSGQFAAQAKAFSSVETTDKYTVVIKADTPQPLLFDFFEQVAMVDMGTIQGADKSQAAGTGPFMYAEYIQGDHITLARNTNYWQSGRPYLDQVKTLFLKDAPAMITQLESGAIDMVRRPPIPDVVRLKKDPNYQIIVHPAGGSAYLLGVNTTIPPFDDKRVRQALNYAIDRQHFADTLLAGLGQVQDLPWPESSPAYEASKIQTFAFDLDKARSLLAEAQVSNLNLDLEPLDPGDSVAVPFDELYQADLAKIGVTANIKQLDPPAWTASVLNRQYNGVYGLTVQSYLDLQPGTPINGAVLRARTNNSGFTNATYDSLVMATTTEPDPAKLKQIYSQINDILLDECPVLYVTLTPVTQIARPNAHGFTPTMWGGAWALTDAWVD
jgi:peptide/nickel transport system substrate-binding protein